MAQRSTRSPTTDNPLQINYICESPKFITTPPRMLETRFGSEQRFEFVELMNVSETETLDLAGVHFSAGIDFQFPDLAAIPLAPGEIVLIGRDQDALAERFPEPEFGPLNIVGTFQNGTALANGGETIKLEDVDGNTILEFTYDDDSPWPKKADGDGSSLAIIDWANDQDASSKYDDPNNWHANSVTPGTYVFVDNFELPGDANQDGIVSFADFLILSGNFGKTSQGFQDGDFDGTGTVDFADFLILSKNFGKRN